MRRIRYARLGTERANPRSRALDRMTPLQIATLMNREDRRAVLAGARVAPQIAAAVEMIVEALRPGGRPFFVWGGAPRRPPPARGAPRVWQAPRVSRPAPRPSWS